MAMTTARGVLVALAPILVAAANVAPAAPSASDKDRAAGPAEKVRQALNAPVDFKAEKQSLTAAIEMLKEKGKVNLVLDTVSIQQLGWLPDHPPTPVDVDLKDVKLKTALRTVLEPYASALSRRRHTSSPPSRWRPGGCSMRQPYIGQGGVGLAFKQLRPDGRSPCLTAASRRRPKRSQLELEDATETAVRLLSEMVGPPSASTTPFAVVPKINKDGVPPSMSGPTWATWKTTNQVESEFILRSPAPPRGRCTGPTFTPRTRCWRRPPSTPACSRSEKGVVKVTMVTGTFYKSTTRNGVTSSGGTALVRGPPHRGYEDRRLATERDAGRQGRASRSATKAAACVSAVRLPLQLRYPSRPSPGGFIIFGIRSRIYPVNGRSSPQHGEWRRGRRLPCYPRKPVPPSPPKGIFKTLQETIRYPPAEGGLDSSTVGAHRAIPFTA